MVGDRRRVAFTFNENPKFARIESKISLVKPLDII